MFLASASHQMAEIKRIKCETIAKLNKKSDEDQYKVE